MDPLKPIDRAILPFDARCKSRLLVTLESGEQAAIVVERGRLLRGGDRVHLDADREVEIVAADEDLLEALSADPLAIAKAAFHLGNRHVAVQVMPNRLRFLDDHVLGVRDFAEYLDRCGGLPRLQQLRHRELLLHLGK